MTGATFVLLLVAAACLAPAAGGEFVTSMHQVKKLLRMELRFVADLRKYVELLGSSEAGKLTEHLDRVYPRRGIFAKDVDQVSGDELEAYVSNPLQSLELVKRTSQDSKEIGEALASLETELYRDLKANLTRQMSEFPSIGEYVEACESLALLQEAYGLNTTDLVAGIVRTDAVDDLGNRYPPYAHPSEMGWLEAGRIGIVACNWGWFDVGIEWLQLALERCPEEARRSKPYLDTRRQRDAAIANHDHLLDRGKSNGYGSRLFALPFDERLRRKKKYREARERLKRFGTKRAKVERPVAPLFVPGSSATSMHNFRSLCRVGTGGWRSPGSLARYRCRYEDHSDPYLRLSPFKLEELNDRPFVVKFSDVLGEAEMEMMKAEAAPILERSIFGTTIATTKSTRGKTRTSQQSWLYDKLFRFPVGGSYRGIDGNGTFAMEGMLEESHVPPYVGRESERYRTVRHPRLFAITRRIALATRTVLGLPLSDEHYQVANYGVGGQYGVHLDPSGYHDGADIKESALPYYRAKGDRLATFMAYLSDTEVGGGTVFPLLGIRNSVAKGDAMFWLNLHSSGHKDHLTFHGGCPVLVGSKWITNKWIGFHDQGLENYPCGLKARETFGKFDEWRSH